VNVRPRHARITRDGVLFALGVTIVLHETFGSGPPSEALIGVAVLLLGLPAVIRADERRSKS
jgi:hypothetical protein